MAEDSVQRHEEEILLNLVDCSDGDNYDLKGENSLHNIQRYSRYDLLSLRNEQISQHHPECALLPDLQVLSIWTCRLRCELQYLGLWKLTSTGGNQYGTCGSNASCCQLYTCADSQQYDSTGGSLVSNNVCFADGQQQSHVITSSSPTLGNKRAVRSRERFLNHQRCINTELITTTSPGEVSLHNSNHQNIKASFVDHRSISSSHLMPAFAKRRMGNVNSSHSSSDSRNNGSNTDQLDNDVSDECERSSNHHETSKIRNDVFKADDHINYKTSATNGRINKNYENVDNQKLNSDFSLSNNKTNSVGVNQKKSFYDRRIGSGRLVSRDVNWDIRPSNGKPIDKNTTSATHTEEKDNTINITENQRNSSTRFSDTSSTQQDRRLYDLRVSNTEDTNAYKEKNETNVNSNNRHLTNHEDERNNLGTNTNHYQQPQPQHFMNQRSMSFRRREYDQRDYREFREQQKDSRERRELREPKGHHRDKEEPEWFIEGPTSQHDTIELRGFEELDATELDVKHSTKLKRKSSERSLSQSRNIINITSNENPQVSNEVLSATNNAIIMDKDNSCQINNKQNKDITDDIGNNSNILQQVEIKDNANADKFGSNVTEMFFDNFLNMEALESSIVCDQNQTTNDGNSSRFSRWFSNNTNNNTCSSEELIAPIRDDHKPNKDYQEYNKCSDTYSFMAFLKCNNLSTPVLPKSVPVKVSALSVEELEARMRKIDSCGEQKMDEQTKCFENSDSVPQKPDKPSKDVEAFRKILDQLGKPQVDISMKIILPQTGHPISLPSSINVVPSGISSNSLPPSSLLKHEYMLKMMHQQQLLQHHQNLIKVIPPPQQNRVIQLPSQQKETKSENMPSTPVSHSSQIMSLVLSQPKKIQDVEHLMQSLARGEVSLNLLEHELNKLNTHNESCNAEFKEESGCVTRSEKTMAGTIMPASQETSSDNKRTMLCEQNDFVVNSHHDDSPLHIPTPRELQTQAIMQNAIKKLELEQKEAISRRQEIHHKQVELEAKNKQQPHLTSNMHHHARHNSPTPLAFTPTSVLRKMTAEKDSTQQIRNQQLSYQHVNQPRMILGGRNNQPNLHQQQQQVTTSANGLSQISTQQKDQIRIQPPAPIKWSSVPHSSMNSIHPLMNNTNKPMGRPILKGPVPTTSLHIPNQHQQSSSHLSQITPQHNVTEMQKYATQQLPRQIVGQQFPTHILQHQMDPSHQNNTQQFFQHQRPTIMHCQQLQQTDVVNHSTIPPVHHPANVNNNSATNLNYQRDGRLSPTSNQLAQWFSPELLAQASAGKLPLLNMNQALSLEEFERSIQHSSTALHN